MFEDLLGLGLKLFVLFGIAYFFMSVGRIYEKKEGLLNQKNKISCSYCGYDRKVQNDAN